MRELYCLFMMNPSTGFVEKCMRFADTESVAMYTSERNPDPRFIFSVEAMRVGSRIDEFVFTYMGWSVFAEWLDELKEEVGCWAFSSPVLGLKKYYDWKIILSELRAYNEKWEESHI